MQFYQNNPPQPTIVFYEVQREQVAWQWCSSIQMEMEFSSITSMIINKGEQKQKTKQGKVKLPPKNKQTRNLLTCQLNLHYC